MGSNSGGSEEIEEYVGIRTLGCLLRWFGRRK
jgi:hypothetical protein